VVATNVAGTTYGLERSFRTAAQALDFTIYTLGDLTLNSGSVQGRVAAGGNATLSSISIGNGLSGISDVLIVGGDVNYSGGSVKNGNVVYGGTAIALPSIPNGTARQEDNPLSSSTEAWVKDVSTAWKNLPPNGTAKLVGTTLTLRGSNPGKNVFTVSGADLAKAKTLQITIDAPPGSAPIVIINISGTDTLAASITLSGADADHVVYNFYEAEATKLTVSSNGVPGTIWAPFANVTISGGPINGAVLAQSLQATSISFNGPSFVGPLP